MTVRARTNTGASSTLRQATVRGNFVLLGLTVVAAAGVLLHNRVDLPTTTVEVLYWGPAVVYVVAGLLGCVPRLQVAANWALLVWAWAMVITALITMIPSTAGKDFRADPAVHYSIHILIVVLQIPLIVMLLRRLAGESCRWTTSG